MRTATGSKKRQAIGLAGLSLMLASSLAVPAVADHAAPPDCPEIMTVDELNRGMTGVGWTVADGTHRESFDVEVLSVYHDTYLDRDVIVVDTSGEVIETHGGIWYGMSGSPVYVDGRLIGAVGYSLSYGPSTIAALTPAEDLLAVLDYASEPDATTRPSPRRVSIPDHTRQRIQQATGTASVGTFLQLGLPLSISGLPTPALLKVKAAIKRERLPFLPYLGASASSGQTSSDGGDIHAGDNLAVVLAYGDVTEAGIGTASVVCDGRVIGFAHSFNGRGATELGASAAESIAVVGDSFFTYELAQIGEEVGTVDQDRLAGIRAELGPGPEEIPITSSVRALNNGRSDEGLTEALVSNVVPFTSWAQLYSSILSTMDQYGAGRSEVSWSIAGMTESGMPFDLSRTNKYSARNIASASSFELVGQLSTLLRNRFEDIEFTGVDITATAGDEVKVYKVTDVLVSTDGVRYRNAPQVHVRRGARVFLRVLLAPSDSGGRRTVELSVRVPRAARSATIEVGSQPAAGPRYICFYRPRRCAQDVGKVGSFEELVDALQSVPRNDEVTARLRVGRKNNIAAEDRKLLDEVVRGTKTIAVILK